MRLADLDDWRGGDCLYRSVFDRDELDPRIRQSAALLADRATLAGFGITGLLGRSLAVAVGRAEPS